MVTVLIYFIACHGAPAAHFSEFAKEPRKEGCRVEILAIGPALDKLQRAGAKEFNPEGLDINDPASQRLLADAVLYYQTSMAPQFALAGIPAIQVGHDTYPDILVRNNLAPSVSHKEKLLEAVKACAKPPTNGKLLADLGISPHWLAHLKSALVVSDHAAR